MSSTVRDQAMKAMKMQWDIKNKAEKQRDFLRDVKHWEDESRKKDVKLKHSATTDVQKQQKKSRPDSPVQPERLEIQNRTKMDEPKQFFDPKPHTAKIEEISQSSKLNNRHKSEKVHKSTARSQLQAVQNSEECKGNHVPEQKYVASIDYSPPKSFSEFSRVWRSLRKRPEALGLYIKLVEPSRLPKLLRSGIDSDMFEEMIRAVHAQFYSDQPKLAFKYLVSLSEIERFDMAVMFLGSDAKSYIKEILTAVAKSLSQSEVSRVSLCYDVRLS
eukprot:359848_1